MKEILSPAEILTEDEYLRLILKMHTPKQPAGFISEPPEVFLRYIPVRRTFQTFSIPQTYHGHLTMCCTRSGEFDSGGKFEPDLSFGRAEIACGIFPVGS